MESKRKVGLVNRTNSYFADYISTWNLVDLGYLKFGLFEKQT
jgi:hypothetical protein